MQYAVVARVIGLLLLFYSLSFLPPMGVSLLYRDGALDAFLWAWGITLGTGVVLWWPARRRQREIRIRDGFVIVTLFWTVLALFSALPFALAHEPHMSLTDAFFESMSGFTTTGSTVLTGIDHLPASIRYYRQQLQGLGGMGVIVLALAVLPMLGVGGMQLYRAETPGPIKNTKLTPRIADTAKSLWYIYVGLIVACALAYWAAGMDVFDAVGHSFSTVSTGGYSTHDASMGYFDNPAIHLVAVVFMFLGGINFALHFLAWRQRGLRPYFSDPEVKAYVGILFVVTAVCVAVLIADGTFSSPREALRHGLFQAVSIATSTGFTSTDFSVWPTLLPVLLITSVFIGGCAGSTAGGMKVLRALLLYKQGKREMFRLIHPDAIMPIKLGGKAVDDSVLHAVWGFFALYVSSFGTLALLVTATGVDFVTGFSAVAACITNLGPGLGEVAAHYGGLPDAAKWILCFAMLLGRLELFTLLVLLTPSFWRT